MTISTMPPLTAPADRPVARSVRVVRAAQASPPGLRPPTTSGPHRAATPSPVSCERSYPPDLRGSGLTRRGQLLVGVVWLVLGVIAALPILRSDGAGAERPAVTTTVVVNQGDTLWELAREVDAAADPRSIVRTIVELNGLRSGADIHPGDALVVPAPG